MSHARAQGEALLVSAAGGGRRSDYGDLAGGRLPACCRLRCNTGKEQSPAEIRRRLAAIPGIILGQPGKIKGSKHPSRIRKREETLAAIVLEERR